MKFGDPCETPLNYCLSCGTYLNRASSINEDRTPPNEGDITVCICCGHLMAFTADMLVRELTDEEIIRVAGDRCLVAMQRIRKGIVMSRAFDDGWALFITQPELLAAAVWIEAKKHYQNRDEHMEFVNGYITARHQHDEYRVNQEG